jgi:hypothetical protein
MFRDGSTKATRILLFLSPLLYFMSPLISVRDSLGLSLVNSFRKGVPGCFPRECLYGVSLLHLRPPIGKRGLAWVAGSLIYPFAAPLVLAFMSPKYGSDADTQRCARFPLLSAYLAPLPPATGLARASRAPRPGEVQPRILQLRRTGRAPGTTRGSGGAPIHGVDQPGRFRCPRVPRRHRRYPSDRRRQDVATPIRPRKKVAAALHPSKGPTKFFEYYPKSD